MDARRAIRLELREGLLVDGVEGLEGDAVVRQTPARREEEVHGSRRMDPSLVDRGPEGAESAGDAAARAVEEFPVVNGEREEVIAAVGREELRETTLLPDKARGRDPHQAPREQEHRAQKRKHGPSVTEPTPAAEGRARRAANFGAASQRTHAGVESLSMVTMPPFLRQGDAVALVAPSSPFEPTDLGAVVGSLGAWFDVRFSPTVLERDDYLAGPDVRRLLELQAALDDDEVRAILAIRGGYGAGRIVGLLDATTFRAAPKWIVGFSDITVLHAWAQRQGVASLHGPNAGSASHSEPEAASIARALLGSHAGRRWAVHARRSFEPVEGLAAGGNLTILAMEATARRLPPMAGRVVFLEDVGERIYRIDRMLAALSDGGAFEGVRALVFGHFARCEGTDGGRTLERVVDELEERLGVPVVRGAPFGHEGPNETFVQGAPVRVESSAVVFP